MAWLAVLRRYWKPIRAVVGLALLGIAIWVLTGKSSELSGAGAFLANPHWGWLVLAASAELCSFLAAAALQQILLRAGEVRARLRRLTALTFAGYSVQSALPVGAAFAGLYVFRQYQFLGADEVLAGWVVVGAAMVAFATIASLAGVALALAASAGTTFDLAGAIAGVVAVAILAVIAWVYRAHLYAVAARAVSALERTFHRSPGQWRVPLGQGFERMRAVAPARGEWAQAWLAGTINWVADVSCLGFAFLAVGGGVPWRFLLLAYCGGQLATLLPITPGGLGVVEGSLTVALVAFGGARATTVAAVLFYRLFSFWVPLPVGAVCYAGLGHMRRRALRLGSAGAPAGHLGPDFHEGRARPAPPGALPGTVAMVPAGAAARVATPAPGLGGTDEDASLPAAGDLPITKEDGRKGQHGAVE
jgi:uncharacterized protein (TIRG00374 family)